jgi:predicted nucleotidyltransferase
MKAIPIPLDEVRIADACRRHHIERLSLFGSVLRDDFRPDSDVDVLVEFEPGHIPGWNSFDMQDELAQIIGREVDFNAPKCLSAGLGLIWRRTNAARRAFAFMMVPELVQNEGELK